MLRTGTHRSIRGEHPPGNLLATEPRLEEDDMARLAALDRSERQLSSDGLAPAWN